MIYHINHLPQTIPVGVQTEQGVEDIGFDLKPWLAVFPDMVFTVWATRPGEEEAYPVNNQLMIGTVLYWHPDGFDTALYGTGRVEIVGVGDNQRKLSGFVDTAVRATSLSASKDPGENTVPWYEKIINAAMEIAADVDVGAGGLYIVTAKHPEGERYIQYADRTQEEIRAAVAAGKTCVLVDADGRVYTHFGEEWHSNDEGDCPTFIAPSEYRRGTGIVYWCAQVLSNGLTSCNGYNPARTPNPHKLTFSGASNAEYDGSEGVSVAIPDVYIVKATQDENYKSWADRTQAEVRAAVKAGKVVLIVDHMGEVFHYVGEYSYDSPDGSSGNVPTFFSDFEYSYGKLSYHRACILADGRVTYNGYSKIMTPTPYKLTIGEQTYDGSEAVTVELPVVPEDAEKLCVVAVKWDAAANVWVSDRSRAEIDAAQAAGKACLMHFSDSGEVMTYRGRYKFASNMYINNVSAPGLYFDWAELNDDQTVVKYGGGPLTANPGAVSPSKGTCYLRWNGTAWEAATIDQLKTDLGLT